MKFIFRLISFSHLHLLSLFIVISLSCLTVSVSGQLLKFSHYGVSDGISQGEILCIFQDSEGYLWFGTQNGLNKFDSYSFERFFHDPADTSTISSSWIFDITEDQNGLLWIGTKDGLNRYDKKTGRFSKINISGSDAEREDKFVYSLAVDGSHIYIGSMFI